MAAHDVDRDIGQILAELQAIRDRLDNMEPAIADYMRMKARGLGFLAGILFLSGTMGAGAATWAARMFGADK